VFFRSDVEANLRAFYNMAYVVYMVMDFNVLENIFFPFNETNSFLY
jgi:hypothetical protein